MTEPRPPIAIHPLETDRLVLLPLDPEADAGDLHWMAADPEVHRFGDTLPSPDVGTTRARLRREMAENGGTSWTIRLRGQPDALGTIGIFSDQGTTIRGIGWSLRRSHWGQGISTEAAKAVMPVLLAQPGVDGLEAWVDAENSRSLAVARNAGLRERARMPRSYRDRISQTVVMAIGAVEAPIQPVVSVQTTLSVTDVTRTVEVLTRLLGLTVAWSVGEPSALVHLAIAPWSGSPGVMIARGESAPHPIDLTIDVGVSVDEIARRAQDLGLQVPEPPNDKPWYRRQCTLLLPDGHRVHIVGATSPR